MGDTLMFFLLSLTFYKCNNNLVMDTELLLFPILTRQVAVAWLHKLKTESFYALDENKIVINV